MAMKFTEEQYQEIIKAWRGEAGYVKGVQAVLDYLSSIDMSFMAGEAVALANTRTREWARERYVEKEKKYIWDSKEVNKNGDVKRLYDSGVGVTDSFRDKNDAVHVGNWLTETEVKKWGYNPDMFDNREV